MISTELFGLLALACLTIPIIAMSVIFILGARELSNVIAGPCPACADCGLATTSWDMPARSHARVWSDDIKHALVTAWRPKHRRAVTARRAVQKVDADQDQ